MKYIHLTNGGFTRVSDGDYANLRKNPWRWTKSHNHKRVVRSIMKNGRYALILIHRVIKHAPDGVQVDHRDLNGLNNARSNLRLCTQSQNMANRPKQRNNTSGYKGVFYKKHAHRKKWHAMVNRRGAVVNGHYHSTPEDAAREYDVLAKQVYGKFARLNFP